MKKAILHCIGSTSMVRLTSINNTNCNIYVKLENKNPGGSIKDRIALHMIYKALKRGDLPESGGTIIEPTSGNTGIALAMIAGVMDWPCILVMPESMSIERQKLMRAYGAKLVLTPAKEGMGGSVKKAEELVKSIPHAYMPNQFCNEDAVEAHYETTALEIYETFNDNNIHLDALVSVFGTGATISGCGLYLKEKDPEIKIYAVEPSASPLLSEGKSGSHAIQGIGANFIPSILKTEVIDKVYTVSDKEAIATAKLLMQKEGISCGISSGANVAIALELAKQKHMQGKNIITFICDTGERYLSTELFD